MRRSKTLEKLRAGKPVRICALGHFIPGYVHQAARAGFDCIWLDLEHRLIDEREVQALLSHFHLADIDCMLRPPTTEKTRLYRYLEEGASGLLVPHVSKAEKARTLVEAVKFPPLGDRGMDGTGLDCGFDFPEADYTEAANRETFLVVQIETLEAVANVESIAAVDGVAGLFVGPGDLGLRLRTGKKGETLEAAIEKVAHAAQKHGKAWGLPAPTLAGLQKYRDMGAQLLVQGSEFRALKDMLALASGNFDRIEDV
jgi:4-hydroxy-2-oxoheptanedioate aldolase